MTELDTNARVAPQFRNINAFKDLPSYRLPLGRLVSILHRISGALMFLLLPFIIWMFDNCRFLPRSPMRASQVRLATAGRPAALLKLLALALIWAYLHHLIAGLRHLWMDVSHDAVSKEFGKSSAAGDPRH
jgi:succinate dehydrogenase / fumarate reductase cytochrome b subunit